MVKTTRSCASACAAAVIFHIREKAHREPTFYICLLQPLCPSLSFFSFLLNFGYPSGHIESRRAEKRPKLHGCAPCVILNHASHLKKKTRIDRQQFVSALKQLLGVVSGREKGTNR